MWHSYSGAEKLIGPAFHHLLCVCVCVFICICVAGGISVFGYKRHIHTVWLLKLYSCVCECVFCMWRLCDSHKAAHPDHCHFIIGALGYPSGPRCVYVCVYVCVCVFVIHCFCNVPNPFFIPLWKSYRIMLILPFTSRGKLDCHLISYRLWLILLFFFFFVSPAASSISSESPPVSSPATNHSSPVSTPKRGPLGPGPVLVPPAGHTVPNTPPVVTIAPTKTSNGLWRSEGRQVNISSAWPFVFCICTWVT